MFNQKSYPDLLITLPVFLLTSLGILIIYSSSSSLAVQQLIFMLVGMLIYWALSSVDVEIYAQYSTIFYLITLFLLVVVFILGVETRGSLRWIDLGVFRLQPSELAKPAMILFLANFWNSNRPSWKNIFKSLLLISPILGLIFKQPDLGTTLTMLVIWAMMLVGASVSVFKFSAMGIISLVFAPVTWFILKDYQKERLLSFLSPQRDPLGIGYNVIQSTIAVGSGSLFGRGLGRGTQSRLQFLPEYRTDFIFASIAEELGFIGSMLVLGLYALLLGRIIKILYAATSKFGSLVIFGVLGMLFFQIFVNIGMNTGIMPITGITLPLLSYGGSSLITTLACLGFVASINRFGRRSLGSSTTN